jgi:hypothetical protein
MKRLQTPEIVNSLYRDLRDRRLLIPALGLIVAILAVPFLLAGGGDEPATPAVATGPPADATEVSAAVLAEQSGIRNYRERLSSLKEKNPFKQQYVAPEPGSDTAGTVTEGAADSSASSETSAGSAASSSPTSSVEPSTPPDTTPTDPPDTDDNEPSPDSNHKPKPEVRFVVGRVDVSFGEAGDAKELDGVRELDFIPGNKNPIASFIGLAGNGDHAVFGLTPSVVDTRGDGSCSPKGACQFLRLGEGDTHYLKTDGGKTYKLTLVATHLVPIADPRKDD